MIWGVAGLRPNFFSSGRIFLAELAQESWRDLAAVVRVWPSQGAHLLCYGDHSWAQLGGGGRGGLERVGVGKG
jgi:hypothetical protein